MYPEWAVRAPIVLLTMVSLYLLYKGVAKTCGRRAAFLGGLVLATMPDFYFMAHQTMTDMPFVAAMMACMGLVLVGLATPEDERVRAYEVVFEGGPSGGKGASASEPKNGSASGPKNEGTSGPKNGGTSSAQGSLRIRLTAWHLVFGVILLCALPQILYLLSRNIGFVWRSGARGFLPHWDEFQSGSGLGNCGLPGNEACHSSMPASVPAHMTGGAPLSFGPAIWRTLVAFEPGVQAFAWLIALGVVLYMSWGERRVRRLCYLGAWLFAALSTLAKGPAGFGLPVLITIAAIAASRPRDDLVARILRVIREISQFEIVAGLLLLLAVGLPWYVAMYVRHGPPFTDRLIFHDMFNRAFHHVHDTNEGDDTSFRFYVWQLGYALFPWTGLAPLALLWWMKIGGSPKETERSDTCAFLCLWFVFGFGLFSFMGTKFHHYIFPAVPAVAMLLGVLLDDMLGDRPITEQGKLWL
jgi:4-amino-4-deoxy-L-arabinose transferase-like glycosyltransferase